MPVIKSAIKKARQNLLRRERNRDVKRAVKEVVDKFRKSPSTKLFAEVSSILDKAAKKNIFHKNKSARLKSRLSKLLSGGKSEKAVPHITGKLKKKSARGTH